MKRPWMPLYVADFQLDTLDLEADQVGVYIALLMLMWRREDAALPNDMEWLKRTLKRTFAKFHGHQFNRIVPPLLKRYFTLGEDDKWRNKRLTNERQTADKLSEKRKQMADKRWAATKEINNLPDTPASDLHMPAQCYSQSQLSKEESKKDLPADGGSKYVFDSGVIRITQKDMDRWRSTFTEIDVPAVLETLTEWAATLPKGKWFHAVKAVLAKRNQEARERRATGVWPFGEMRV